MLKLAPILGLLAVASISMPLSQAVADHWEDESGHDRGYYEREHRHGDYRETHREGRHGYKREWHNGNCKYKYKAKRHGYKEEWKCKGGGYHTAGPPPWAPAHGYRRYHHRPAPQVVDRRPINLSLGRCSRETVGTLLGAAGGGYLGSRIGKGDGRLAAVGAGVFIGAIIGGSIGRSMDEVDQNCVGNVLEQAPDGETIIWNNPNNRRYQVTPTRTYQERSGRYCREYTTNAVINGRHQQMYGTACRQPDGSWQLIS